MSVASKPQVFGDGPCDDGVAILKPNMRQLFDEEGAVSPYKITSRNTVKSYFFHRAC